MAGQIVLVTGTSGSGKTTTCSAFARRAEEPYLMFGMDLLVGTLFPAKYTMFGSKKVPRSAIRRDSASPPSASLTAKP